MKMARKFRRSGMMEPGRIVGVCVRLILACAVILPIIWDGETRSSYMATLWWWMILGASGSMVFLDIWAAVEKASHQRILSKLQFAPGSQQEKPSSQPTRRGPPPREFYLEVLGLSRDASDVEIKSAWRNVARQCHPDRKPGDIQAKERFHSAKEAYENLIKNHTAKNRS